MWLKAILVVAISTCFCLYVCSLAQSQWVLTITLPYRCESYRCFTYAETKAQRLKWTAQHHNQWLWVLNTGLFDSNPVLLNKSLYIFNSLKLKMYKRQLSDSLVFWPLGFASLEKILQFLEFSFRVNSKHINYIGEYITYFTFPVFFCALLLFHLTMDLEIFSQSIYRHFLFFCSCSLQAIRTKSISEP